jgi:iron complex outermembrane receptor protein
MGSRVVAFFRLDRSGAARRPDAVRFMAGVSGLAVLMAAGIAAAADAPPAPAPGDDSAQAASASAQNGQIGEIVVTASKRAETLSHVPLAISAVTSAGLEQQGITTVTALSSSVPNLQIAYSSTGAAQVSIRGISTNNTTELGNSAVAFNINGVYEPRPEGIIQSLYDVDRIEVLRGPQGTLYGRNATAGSINVITAQPTFRFGGEGDISYGNYNDILVRGELNVPVSDTFALRFAGTRETNDGYSNNLGSVPRNYDLTDQYALRVTGLWKPTDNFTWSLEADDFSNAGTPPLSVFSPSTDQFPLRTRPVNTPGFLNIDMWAIRSRMSYQINNNWSLAYVAGYGHLQGSQQMDTDGTTANLASTFYERNESSYSHEVDLEYNSDRIKFILGGIFFREDPHILLGSNAGATTTQFYDQTIFQQSKAVFSQVTYSITSRLRLTGGLRYTDDNAQRALQNNWSCPIGTPLAPPGPPASAHCVQISHIVGQNQSWDNLSYKAGLDFDVTDSTLAYATVSTGYKAGGLGNNIVPNFGPEHVTNYEIGAKSRLFSDTLQVNASLFYMDYQDLQVTSLVTIPATGSQLAGTVNAAKASIKGLELETIWAPTRDDRISGYLALTDARYDKFVNAIDSLTGKTNVDLTGRPLELAPSLSWRAAYQHIFHIGDATLTPQVAVYGQDSMYLRFIDAPVDLQKGYTKTDMLLTYAPPGGHWTLEGFVHNLENSNIASGENVVASRITRYYQPPRTYGMRVGVKF